MIVLARSEVKCVDWGNGLSYRFLLTADAMGFTVAHTVVRANSKSRLQYRMHLEACYCIAGGRGADPRRPLLACRLTGSAGCGAFFVVGWSGV